MPDVTLSSAMDSFLQESDPADVFLPLAGGTMSGELNVANISNLLNTDLVIDAYNDDGAGTHNYFTFNPYGGGLEMPDNTAGIVFNNASRLREGLTDAGNGGAGGIAMVCSLDYEFKWEAGRLYVMGQDGFTIRTEMFGFTAVPTSTDDDAKGYIVGSRRILDDGTVYVCTDATEDAAVWEYQGIRDIAGLDSINQDTRKLIASDGTTEMLNWSSSSVNIPIGITLGVDMIYDADSPSRYIDVANGELGDYNGATYTPSIDWANRDLYHSDGSYSLSWQIRKLYDSAGVEALDWSGTSAGVSITSTSGTGAAITSTSGVGAEIYSGSNWGAEIYSTSSIGAKIYSDSGTGASISTNSGYAAADIYHAGSGIGASIYSISGVGASISSGSGVGASIYSTSGAGASISSGSGDHLNVGDGLLVVANNGDTTLTELLIAKAVTATPNTVAALTGGEGTIAYVNDADTPVIGSAVVGGASAKCLVCYNGTAWIVTSLL